MRSKGLLYKTMSLIMAASIAGSLFIPAATAAESPEAVYSGIANTSAELNNMDYSDVKKSSSWVKAAVYEGSALDILKSYGNKQYGLTKNLTKEQALGIVYRAAGKEAVAQQAGETLNNARAAASKKTDSLSIWGDGYLQLAAKDGLISQQDFQDSQTQDQTKLKSGSFLRGAPVQRQEMACWMAKVLNIQPVYGQKTIFNSYRDWTKADTAKVPYIEAILQNDIMSGDAKGYFNPQGPVTAQQAAQITVNAEGFILPLNGLEKKTGTIEAINKANDYSNGSSRVETVFNVRSSNGKLDQIVTDSVSSKTGTSKNEKSGSTINQADKDLVVYKNGALGNSSILKKGDRIEYIVGQDNGVRYVNVLSSTVDTTYIAAKLNTLDTAKSQINVSQYFKLNYPDINLAKATLSFKWDGVQVNVTYKYSGNAAVTVDGEISEIGKLAPGMDVVLTVKNNVVVAVDTFKLDEGTKGETIIKGIVEDNNPQLGYITLYNEDGTGTSVNSQLLRTYNYADQNDLVVYKNHKLAKVEDVETGDTVFLKTDDKGNISEVSAVDNYVVKYGKVISKKPKTLAVEYDNGVQQVLDIDSGTLVISENRLATYNSLKDGDRIKLTLHITNKFTRVKEITVEGDEHFVSNIYKGTIERLDDTSNRLITRNLEVLNNGQWIRTDTKGFTPIKLADEYSIYFDNKKVDPARINNYMKDTEAYLAVEKDYGGEEQAVFISLRNGQDTEDEPYDDSVTNAVSGSGKFYLSKKSDGISSGEGTIVVKDGRLVTPNSIAQDDLAYVIANRSYDTGDYYAGVVQITQRSNMDFVQVYRGRIKSINENRDFTVESYSQLKGLNWEYANTPKTFKLDSNTSIVDDSGVVSQRDFTDYGDKSYGSRTVYVLSNGTTALLVSTAPYGNYNVQGEIADVTGASIGEEGTVLGEPTGIKLIDVSCYDLSQHLWIRNKDLTLSLLKNSVILKDNKIAKPSDLRKGDKVRILKKQDDTDLNAYIISVEN